MATQYPLTLQPHQITSNSWNAPYCLCKTTEDPSFLNLLPNSSSLHDVVEMSPLLRSAHPPLIELTIGPACGIAQPHRNLSTMLISSSYYFNYDFLGSELVLLSYAVDTPGHHECPACLPVPQTSTKEKTAFTMHSPGTR